MSYFPVDGLVSGLKPKNRRAKQAHRRNTQKCCRAAKAHNHQPKECGAERSTDSGRGSNDALGQIEVTAAAREIGDDQRREHPDHRPTDAIEQLKANEKRWRPCVVPIRDA